MAEVMDVSLRKKPFKLSHCTKVNMVTDLHNRLVAKYNEHRDHNEETGFVKKYGTLSFPEPPVPGSDTFHPIGDYKALKQEGRSMHHCVGSYAGMVMEHHSYIYAVHEPQRATLELVHNKSTGRWKVNQLHLACNLMPSEATSEAVARWLEAEERPALSHITFNK